uniref:Putative secreted protein n=1 Tax=Anopheles darlingi TaxID=43151 RepID=A0A2M4D3Q8_ANODA
MSPVTSWYSRVWSACNAALVAAFGSGDFFGEAVTSVRSASTVCLALFNITLRACIASPSAVRSLRRKGVKVA